MRRCKQFGHAMTAVIKLILLIEGRKLNYTNILDFYWKEDGYPRWNSAALETLFQWINATSDPATYSPVLLRGVDLLRTPMHAASVPQQRCICIGSAVELHQRMIDHASERFF